MGFNAAFKGLIWDRSLLVSDSVQSDIWASNLRKKNGALFFSLDNDVNEVLVQDVGNHPPKYTASYSTDRSSDIRSYDLVWR